MAATMYNNSMPISLDSILQVKPNTWTTASYAGRNYETKELETFSAEYQEIARDIRSQGITETISKIERVQHPFAYGRFLIRKEQLEKRNGGVIKPTRKYYRVSNEQINEALEYNMDNRRATSATSITDCAHLYSIQDCCVVVVQQLTTSKTRDSEVYPEYVVHYD